MFKMELVVDESIFTLVSGLKSQIAEVIADIVWAEFNHLLHDAPQRSGNYVANMVLKAGGGFSARPYKAQFPEKPTNQQIVERGSLPAISYAKSKNENFKANVMRSVTQRAGWLPAEITTFNKTPYADQVEGYSTSELRDPNKAGAHAMVKYEARLQAAFNRNIVIRPFKGMWGS